MMIMKKYILIIIGILTSISLSAQTAEEYLNSVIEKHKSYDDISIVFNCKVVNIENDYNESTTGYASMKGDSYVMNIDGQEMICNGETLWTQTADRSTLQLHLNKGGILHPTRQRPRKNKPTRNFIYKNLT